MPDNDTFEVRRAIKGAPHEYAAERVIRQIAGYPKMPESTGQTAGFGGPGEAMLSCKVFRMQVWSCAERVDWVQ